MEQTIEIRKADLRFDPAEAAAAQTEYCKVHEIPQFAPDNGVCWACGRNIYDPVTYRGREDRTIGIPVEEAANRLITCCPHCSTSFVE